MKQKLFCNWKTIVLGVFVVLCIFSCFFPTCHWLIPTVGILWVTFYSLFFIGFQTKPCELLCNHFCKLHKFREIAPLYQYLKSMKKDNVILTYGHYRHQTDKALWKQGILEQYEEEELKKMWTSNLFQTKEIYYLEKKDSITYFGFIDNFVFLFSCCGIEEDGKNEIKRLVESFTK